MKNKLKAFTLIELLVVIAIIGILAAVVYAPFQKARAKGRDAKKVAEMKSIQTALSLYADSNGGYYPETLTQLSTSTNFKLPALANTSNIFDFNKYNYNGYKRKSDGKVIGYHIWVHLETASPALDGAAKCKNAGLSVGYDCLIMDRGLIDYTGTTEDQSGMSNNVDIWFTNRSNDTDEKCANNVGYCIYDLKHD